MGEWELLVGMFHLAPICFLLPVLISSSFHYPYRANPLSSYFPPLKPFVVVSNPQGFSSILSSTSGQQLLDEPSFHESLNGDGSEEFQPLRFTGFKASQQKDPTMNQVVRALAAFLNQREFLVRKADKIQMLKRDLSIPSYKRDGMSKMQFTRMGRRADDDYVDEEGMDKRDGTDKMQYTRMGKRADDDDVDEEGMDKKPEDDDLDQMMDTEMRMFLAENDDNLEEKIMKWGLLGKRGKNANKMQFTRMGKRDGIDKMQYTRMGKRENGKMQYTRMGKRENGKTQYTTRMGKRNTGADEDLLGE